MAFSMKLKFIGRRQFSRDMAKAGVKIPTELEKNLNKAAALVAGAAQKNMRGQRTRAKRKGRPVTSPPGVLGIDSGLLRKSISWDVRRTSRKAYYAEVGTAIKYGRIHELGGLAGRGRSVIIKRRPYLEPAIKKNEARIVRLIGRTFTVVR